MILALSSGWLASSFLGAARAEDAVGAWPIQPTSEAVYHALSVRDPVPSCASLESMTATPVATLEDIVDHATMPPWAGIRAATCLIDGHSAEIQPTLEKWVTDPALKGLAILTLGSLDKMPESVAIAVAQKAMAGPMAEMAGPRIARSATPSVRVIGTPAP